MAVDMILCRAAVRRCKNYRKKRFPQRQNRLPMVGRFRTWAFAPASAVPEASAKVPGRGMQPAPLRLSRVEES
jgi:hypothetical protein